MYQKTNLPTVRADGPRERPAHIGNFHFGNFRFPRVEIQTQRVETKRNILLFDAFDSKISRFLFSAFFLFMMDDDG